MGYEVPRLGLSFRADVDMSTIAVWQYAAVWLGPAINIPAGTGTGNATVQAQGSLTTPPIGVLQNNPVQGSAAEVMVTGVTKAIAGGTIAVGQLVTANASGAFVVAATGNYVVGQALESAATGDITTVLLRSVYKLP